MSNLGTVKIETLKHLLEAVEAQCQENNVDELSFEFVVGSLFPQLYSSVIKEMEKQYTLGYIAGKQSQLNPTGFQLQKPNVFKKSFQQLDNNIRKLAPIFQELKNLTFEDRSPDTQQIEQLIEQFYNIQFFMDTLIEGDKNVVKGND